MAPAEKPVIKSERLTSFTLQPRSGESIPDFCRRFAARFFERGETPVHIQAFGECQASAAVSAALKEAFEQAECPITWVEGTGCNRHPIAGLQAHAFTGVVERLTFQRRVIGSVFMDGGAWQCVVGGVTADDKTLPYADQTRQAFDNLQSVLAAAGFDLADTVRTWFFLDKILSWYHQFNQVRTEVYSGLKFRTGFLPASTGVGAKNPADTALALAAWAFRPQGATACAEEVTSPLQSPAPNYGSYFSRAMEISSGTGRRLFISGTASIELGGKTLWTGDVRKQVGQAMDVVAAILQSRGFGFADLSRATAYFRRPADVSAFSEWLVANGLYKLPVISTHCDICRDDLLFELEAEAATDK